ncbi:hypothetical protein CDN99_06890 [Roseateles aquatilis]|uniref:Uncharacterized protein n=1 Tax=Roseateles aquatilis TaxID=431061 RepID=A0A246JHT0_9BURK|nr:hypothetical protein [Roseateles aquatilis]OWQ92073.1 hypothetical protein CDN99_06890 [Roseateles aquatilis]
MTFIPTFAAHPRLDGWSQPSWSTRQPPPNTPWPPLDPGINPAHLLHLEHDVLGLPPSIPTYLNATMLPFTGSYLPPVMQAALPPVGTPLHPQGFIGFLAGLHQQSITDVMMVRGGQGTFGSPLLQQLGRPGQSVTCSVPGADGQPVTATVYRTDVPCEDGSWLMQSICRMGRA